MVAFIGSGTGSGVEEVNQIPKVQFWFGLLSKDNLAQEAENLREFPTGPTFEDCNFHRSRNLCLQSLCQSRDQDNVCSPTEGIP